MIPDCNPHFVNETPIASSYSKDYLNDAMMVLGQMTDYGVNDCGFTLTAILNMFIISGIARQFESGHPKYITGMSGEELARTVFRQSGLPHSFPAAAVITDRRTAEYWCGWILAYCQWKTGYSFSKIIRVISPEEYLALYTTLHEASEDKTVQILLERTSNRKQETRLARLRAYAGLSQSGLAHRSGVSLRSIQMYEQRNKDINKAQVHSVSNLAKALGCSISDLMEP